LCGTPAPKKRNNKRNHGINQEITTFNFVTKTQKKNFTDNIIGLLYNTVDIGY
jgi:hypothetical protein